ncbi:MAG: low specificity L-threonine aldolase [Rhodobacteraceae bacterium]|nr:low specificity L-threonine aldolase [Paracoccaceae bacterium]
MNFGSDNMGPVHPRVMEALTRANDGYALPYGEDALTSEVTDRIRDIFEAPEALVYLVALGTAANALALSALVRPWQVIYCSRIAHIVMDECGAVEFYSGGARLSLIDETHAKMQPDALRAMVERDAGLDFHAMRPGAVSITQVTERGAVHSLDELRALTAIARDHDLPVHLDGARFTNALVALGCSPAEMTWKAGVDVVSFGGTKNGLMNAEAVVFFNPEHAKSFDIRRKRAAHLFSKHRYLAAQMLAYLESDLWLDMARSANAAAARLAAGLSGVAGARLVHPADANMIYAALPRAAHRRAVSGGAEYFVTLDDLAGGAEGDMIETRLVCDWSTRNEDVDQLLALLRG